MNAESARGYAKTGVLTKATARDVADKERMDMELSAHPGMHDEVAFIHRMAEARVMLEKLDLFKDEFARANVILELGGGNCWASCLVKSRYPGATVIGSDLTKEAFTSLPRWERSLDVKLDGTRACKSYEIDMPDSSVDLVFSFSSAHHFARHRRSFKDIARVLKPGGTAIYFHEPACPPFWYRTAVKRMNRIGYGAEEDVLLTGKLRQLAREAGLQMTEYPDMTTTHRGPIQGMYYLVMGKMRWLQRFMPCSVDLVFKKTT